MAKTLQGKNQTWQLSDTPIGSGDAGEVYAVSCKENPDLVGVLKKPARIATGGTIQRQANQIAQESFALARLDGLPGAKAHPPRLLDEAPSFTLGTANYFIVSERAPGLDIADMLSETHQSGKPFPRRVIITVLDALFDLFSRAHKAGVLWNDVKLDHIYWHNPSGWVAVIDWGNAQFLDQPEDKRQRLLPRWEDYQQMVETLGGFLQHNAPELYNDLGWDEFVGEELDSPRVSVLARRIAYQQQVMALKVMEYQSLIRVILNSDPSLDGFEKIRGYQKDLLQIGAPWDAEGVLSYGHNLIFASMENKDLGSAIKAVSLVWDLYDEDLELPWHLLREYFRQTDILAHAMVSDLVRFTLNEQWLTALWTLIRIAKDSNEPGWWERIMPVLRQRALELVIPPPLQVSQSILAWYQNESSGQTQTTQKLSTIVKTWRTKGADLAESPFEYEIMGLFQNKLELPRNLRSEFRQSFAAGQDAIRELIKVWENANFEALETAIRKVAGWDPDRWGSLELEKQSRLFQTWLQNLYAGPSVETEPIQYLEQMAESRPGIEQRLGMPPWMKLLIETLDAIHTKAFRNNYHAEIIAWFPWLLKTNRTGEVSHELPSMAIDEILSHFQQHLKSWSDIEAGLSVVRKQAPVYHPECQMLADRFQSTLMLNASHELQSIKPGQSSHPNLDETYLALRALSEWRNHLEEKDPDKALDDLFFPQNKGWRMVAHAQNMTTVWVQEILPSLNWMISGHPGEAGVQPDPTGSPLSITTVSYAEISRIWDSILKNGVHQPALEALTDEVDLTRQLFMKWRQEQEQSADQVVRLIYHAYLDLIRKISNKLLLLSTHSRQANLSLSIFVEGDHVSVPTKLKTLGNILEDLSAVETILALEPAGLKFPEWVEAFSRILTEPTPEGRRQVVLSLSENHPIYNLIVQSIFSS